jgi:hypothetical protein
MGKGNARRGQATQRRCSWQRGPTRHSADRGWVVRRTAWPAWHEDIRGGLGTRPRPTPHARHVAASTLDVGARGGQHHGTAGRRSAREGALQSARTHGTLGQPEFDRLKLKNFEQKFKITKNRNCRWEYGLQLLQRVT